MTSPAREGSGSLASTPALGRAARAGGSASSPAPKSCKQALQLRQQLVEARREKKQGDEDAAKVAAALKLPALYRPIYVDEAYARFSQAVATDRPFLERLTQFWTNHFAVSIDKIVVLGVAGAMEREAIRPHVTGHFTDMLLAVEQHPGDDAVSGQPGIRRAELAGRWFPEAARQCARTAANSTSTRTWRVKSSSCTRWA